MKADSFCRVFSVIGTLDAMPAAVKRYADREVPGIAH